MMSVENLNSHPSSSISLIASKFKGCDGGVYLSACANLHLADKVSREHWVWGVLRGVQDWVSVAQWSKVLILGTSLKVRQLVPFHLVTLYFHSVLSQQGKMVGQRTEKKYEATAKVFE